MKCSGYYFDRFDICSAYYCYAYNFHQGQYSKSYKIFGRLKKLQYKPASKEWNYRYLSKNAKLIFNRLRKINY